jgi:hypothetical protein
VAKNEQSTQSTLSPLRRVGFCKLCDLRVS